MLSSDRFIALWMIQILIEHSPTSTNILEKRKHGQLLQGSRSQETKRAKSFYPSQVDQVSTRTGGLAFYTDLFWTMKSLVKTEAPQLFLSQHIWDIKGIDRVTNTEVGTLFTNSNSRNFCYRKKKHAKDDVNI